MLGVPSPTDWQAGLNRPSTAWSEETGKTREVERVAAWPARLPLDSAELDRSSRHASGKTLFGYRATQLLDPLNVPDHQVDLFGDGD